PAGAGEPGGAGRVVHAQLPGDRLGAVDEGGLQGGGGERQADAIEREGGRGEGGGVVAAVRSLGIDGVPARTPATNGFPQDDVDHVAEKSAPCTGRGEGPTGS